MVISPELEAMATISDALDGLDDKTVSRILRWAIDKYGELHRELSAVSSESEMQASQSTDKKFADIAELFFVATPSTEAERVLVGCYWMQVINKAESLDAQQINSQLKHMGQGASNITRAFDDLINRKPNLVMQIHKNGAGKQARKKYRLTTAGIQQVEKTLSGER